MLAVPVTLFSLPEIAKDVFDFYFKKTPPSGLKENPRLPKREFIFPGILTDLKSGGQFEWCEFAIESLMRLLPGALEDLKNGIQPYDYEAWVLGYPTNEYGKVTNDYACTSPYAQVQYLSELYLSLVQKEMDDIPKRGAVLRLTGVSLGASLAAIVSSGFNSKRNKVQVILYSPVAMVGIRRTGPLAFPLTICGLIAEHAYHGLTNSGTRKLRGEMRHFLKRLSVILSHRMKVRDTGEDAKYKHKALKSLHKAATAGIWPRVGVRARIVLGKHDLLARSMLRKVKRFVLDVPGYQGRTIEMGHQPPFYRARMWQHFARVVRVLDRPAE